MTTLEMMNEAAKTGKTYVTNDMRYSDELGFHDKDKRCWHADSYRYINDIFKEDGWSLLSPKRMTLKDIENELGYEIELVSK